MFVDGADVLCVEKRSFAHPVTRRSNEIQDRLDQRCLVSRFVDPPLGQPRMIRPAAEIGHDQRQTRRTRLAADGAKHFGLTAVDQRIATCHQPREFMAVCDRRKQMDMRVARRCPRHFRAVTPVTRQHEPDRCLCARRGDGLDHHRPAFFGAVTPGPEQQGRVWRQVAAFEQPRAERLIAQSRREQPRFDPHRDRVQMLHPAFAQGI